MRTKTRRLPFTALALALALPSLAAAQTGVSDNRVSLPDGPGSLEGVGDDARITGNMGGMSYSVPMNVPAGFAGMTPDPSLSYSSIGGGGPIGIGWSMSMPSVERRTLTGVPYYDLDDPFDAGGQLVYIGGTSPRTYRSRFESGFALYEWHSAGDGADGYWVVRYPDGRVGYFGADADGRIVDAARIGGDEGTFRYLLHEVVDPWDHRLVYTYETVGGTQLPTSAAYVFVDGDPKYEVTWTWAERPDPIVDATGGFEDVLEHRLASVSATRYGVEVASWDLSWESVAASGGASRLAGVQRRGLGGELYEIEHSFGYASALGALCDGTACDAPFVRDLGSLGVDMQSGDLQLVDLNGDALPDIVDSSLVGEPHRIFFNELGADGAQSFADPVASALGTQDGFDFSNPRVQVVDIDGNGLSDAINTLTGRFLLNVGGLDWDSNTNWIGPVEFPDFEADFSDGELQTIRFVDIDNDRRIDVIRSSGSGDANLTRVYRNTGDGFAVLDGVEPIEAGFDSDTLELNDMNGDGLLDPVQLRASGVRYRLSLGRGRWAPADGWYEASFDDAGLAEGQLATADLEDLNGDGLADVVLVSGSTVRIWVNTGGERLVPMDTIADGDVAGGSIPDRTSSTTVLYADMNGNGSSDVVWVTASGDVTMLDLFPSRPNLLTGIRNSIGMELDIEYASSVALAAADAEAGTPWTHGLPFAQTVVRQVTRNDALNAAPIVEAFDYASGFYDGDERQFRGYEVVTRTVFGDDAQEGSTETTTYDVGDGDDGPWSAGLMQHLELVGDTSGPLFEVDYEYTSCPIEGVTGDEGTGVRFMCRTAEETVIMEGADAGDHVRTRTESTWDGYGQVTRIAQLGVVSLGGGGCAPCTRAEGEFGDACDAECLGDEQFVDRTYIEPGEATGGRWILGRVARERVHGFEGADDVAETVTFYDGDAFVGLAEGQLDRGAVTRVARLRSEGEWIDVQRFELDAHGNVVADLRASADPGEWGGRSLLTFSSDGLRPERLEMRLERGGTRYALRKDYTYDESFDRVASASEWAVVDEAGALRATPGVESWEYDAFGRMIAHRREGDVAPTTQMEWTYADDHVRVTSSTRSSADADGAYDVESHRCYDGFGRTVRTIDRAGDGTYVVWGDTRYNPRSSVIETVLPWSASSVDCTADAPADATHQRMEYDAAGRVTARSTWSGGTELDREEMVYGPLTVEQWDPTDLDPASVAYQTPTVRRQDGLGRTIAVGRIEARGEDPAWYEATWSHRGDLVRLTDPLGNTRTQTHDLEGRVIAIDDPDRGVITYEYDADGLVVREVDATPYVVVRTWDDAGRVQTEGLEGIDDSFTEVVWDFDDACPEGRCTFGANRVVSMRFDALDYAVVDWSGYDTRGRRIWTRRDFGPFALDFGWTYDNLDRVVTQSLPTGQDLSWSHDAQGYTTAISGIIDTVERRADGRIEALTHANGVVQRWDLDARAMPASIEVFAPSGDALAGVAYTWRANRTVDEVLDLVPPTDGPSRSASYGYDASGRVIDAALSMDVAAFAEVVTYEYDLAENIVARTSSLADSSLNDGVRTLDASRPHAVTAIGDHAIEWDEAGRVVRSGDRTYEWDGFGRIAATEQGGRRVEHGYGLQAHRAVSLADDATVFHAGDGFEIRDGVASYHVPFDERVVARTESPELAASALSDLAPRSDAATTDADGFITAGDAWVASAIERGELSAGDGETVDTAPRLLSAAAAVGVLGGGEQTTWLHPDYNESIIVVTDEDGRVAESTVYAPFGSAVDRTANANEPYGFTGERMDADDGALRIGPRGYDPYLGRWLAPDALFETLGSDALVAPWEAMGTYQFGWNSPVNERDETGYTRQGAEPTLPLTRLQERAVVSVVRTFLELSDVGPMTQSRDAKTTFESQNIVAGLQAMYKRGFDVNNDPTSNTGTTSQTDPAINGWAPLAAEFFRVAEKWGPHVTSKLSSEQRGAFNQLMRHSNEARARIVMMAQAHEITATLNRNSSEIGGWRKMVLRYQRSQLLAQVRRLDQVRQRRGYVPNAGQYRQSKR